MLAVQVDTAPVQPDELPRIKQPQAKTPHLSGIAGIDLVKFLKHLGNLITGNSDSRIGDKYADMVAAIKQRD